MTHFYVVFIISKKIDSFFYLLDTIQHNIHIIQDNINYERIERLGYGGQLQQQ